MEDLRLARVRRLKNHSSKLQRADGKLENDANIKEPENSRGQSIVNLQETGCHAEDASHIENVAVGPMSLIPVGPSSEKRRRLKKAETKPKRSENRCTSARSKAGSV